MPKDVKLNILQNGYIGLKKCFGIPSVAFWQGLGFGLAAVSGVASAADKTIQVSFDL